MLVGCSLGAMLEILRTQEGIHTTWNLQLGLFEVFRRCLRLFGEVRAGLGWFGVVWGRFGVVWGGGMGWLGVVGLQTKAVSSCRAYAS